MLNCVVLAKGAQELGYAFEQSYISCKRHRTWDSETILYNGACDTYQSYEDETGLFWCVSKLSGRRRHCAIATRRTIFGAVWYLRGLFTLHQ